MKRPKQALAEEVVDTERVGWIEVRSRATGESWSDGLRSTLRRDGRAAVGGFPGTMSEARAQVSVWAGPSARNRALSAEERETAARAVYSSARRDWLAHVGREDDDDDI